MPIVMGSPRFVGFSLKSAGASGVDLTEVTWSFARLPVDPD